MRYGTEVEILKADAQEDGTTSVELVGTRRFQLVGDPWLQQVGIEADSAPAPLADVAGAISGTDKFIVSRVEFALEGGEEGGWQSEAAEELSMDSEQMLDALVGDADKEANLQQSTGVSSVCVRVCVCVCLCFCLSIYLYSPACLILAAIYILGV
jgi:hypothetical protein